MSSVVIKGQTAQYTLDFEPGLTETFKSLRDCVATGIYKRGLGNVAIDLDEAPGNLSVQLSASDVRHFSIDNFEKYMEKQRDFTPIYYQIEKFLSDKTASKDAAEAEALAALKDLAPLLKKAGLL
jgi:hypothetical protein